MTEHNKLPANISKMEKAIQDMESTLQEGKKNINNIEKEFTKFKKFAASFIENAKRNCERKPRKPSGFVLPVDISNELCEFLDIPHGSQVARTEVTKYIIQYISEHNLSHPEKKTLIVPDEKLGKLLGDDVDLHTLTRFTLQKYMNPHYIQKS
jgi:chromatin remodeling complex protein RSC6